MNPFTRIGPNLALRLGFACGAALSAAAASAQSLTYTPYAITTVAGEPGNSGNANGTGTGAQFNSPYAVAADASGNAYVADTGNNSLRKVTPAGVVTTFAGVTGNFQGIAIDAAGANLYLTNNATGSITKVVISSGAASTLTLTGGTLNQPVGIGLDSAGNIYVADAGNYVIRKISPAGAMTTLAGSGKSGGHDGTGKAAQFGYPAGISCRQRIRHRVRRGFGGQHDPQGDLRRRCHYAERAFRAAGCGRRLRRQCAIHPPLWRRGRLVRQRLCGG